MRAGWGGDAIPKFDHIAVAVWKFADAVPVVVGALGGRPGRGGPSRGFEWRTWAFAGGGQLEVLEPSGPPDGFLHRFLHARGPGVHHVTFIVESLREACARAEAQGFAVVGYDDSNPGWQEAFLHPKQALGLVVQLASSSPEHDAEGYGWEPPPAQAGAPEPVELVGLRTAAPSAAAARRLYQTTLEGEVSELDGALVFRWPDSPMRIAVTLETSLEPGPLALEVRTERAIALLDSDPAASFGARIQLC